jgi:hypothetical protein
MECDFVSEHEISLCTLKYCLTIVSPPTAVVFLFPYIVTVESLTSNLECFIDLAETALC